MSDLFLKYYSDITRYNLLFCVVVFLLIHNIQATIVCFGSVGMVIAFFIYRYYQNIEYYFYLNAGYSKKSIVLSVFIINFIIALMLYFIVWIIH